MKQPCRHELDASRLVELVKRDGLGDLICRECISDMVAGTCPFTLSTCTKIIERIACECVCGVDAVRDVISSLALVAE